MDGSETVGIIHAGYKGQDAIGRLRIKNPPFDIAAGRPLFLDAHPDRERGVYSLRLYGLPKWNGLGQRIDEGSRQYEGTYLLWSDDFAKVFRRTRTTYVAESSFVAALTADRKCNYELMEAMELPCIVMDYSQLTK